MRMFSGSVLAVALTGLVATGCSGSDTPEGSAASGESSSRGERTAAQSLTVSGCLQKQDQLIDEYILTKNATPPNTPVATGGQTAVEQEHLRQAMDSYQLNGMHDELEKLVGSEVRITGRLDEQAQLGDRGGASGVERRGTDAQTPSATGGNTTDREIETSNLAALNVERVEQVAAQCVGQTR